MWIMWTTLVDKLQNVNYDVLNSLNLMSRSLGDAYLLEGYNPFDEDYVLDLENSRKLITNLKQKEGIEAEEFLEKPLIEEDTIVRFLFSGEPGEYEKVSFCDVLEGRVRCTRLEVKR